MKQKSQPTLRTSKPKKIDVPVRSRWIDLQLDMLNVEGDLKQLSPDDFRTNASGITLLTRQLFCETCTVRSKSPLAVVLPGENNRDLIAAGLNESSLMVTHVLLKDPLLAASANRATVCVSKTRIRRSKNFSGIRYFMCLYSDSESPIAKDQPKM